MTLGLGSGADGALQEIVEVSWIGTGGAREDSRREHCRANLQREEQLVAARRSGE